MTAKEGDDNKNEVIDKLEDIFKGTVQDKHIVIDRRKEELILTEECKKVMRNLSRLDTGPMDFTSMNSDDLTQPSFLSADEKVLFFKMKMFYLLQERCCWHKSGNQEHKIADPYPAFLSPFGEQTADTLTGISSASKSKRRRRKKKQQDSDTGDAISVGSGGGSKAANKLKDERKQGLQKFSDALRKADQSTFRMLEEKLLKTSEGKGFACLFVPGISKTDIMISFFPDYEMLMNDGHDEESKLNNLMTHVRCRTKIFEKIQTFYESAKEDNLANMFTTQNSDVTEVNSDIQELANKKLHRLDVKKMNRLFDAFKDDYASAKTTLIADGTQPVVLNRKKAERIKKYVDEYADLKNMLVPYSRDTNFMFLAIPWQKEEEKSSVDKSSVTSLEQQRATQQGS